MTFRIKNHKDIVYKVQSRYLFFFWTDCKCNGSLAWFIDRSEAEECKKYLEGFYNFISLAERKENV